MYKKDMTREFIIISCLGIPSARALFKFCLQTNTLKDILIYSGRWVIPDRCTSYKRMKIGSLQVSLVVVKKEKI